MNTKYTSLTEKKLISMSKNNDTGAFDELILRNEQKIYRWILSKTKNENEADEIFQRTLIKSWRYIKTFKGGSKFSTWANAIARNLFIDDFRKNQRRKEESLETVSENSRGWADFSQRNGGQELESKELLDFTEIVLEKLSGNHKEILQKYYFEDLNYKEIADKMDCSIGTVMSRLFYAKKRAKKIIQAEKKLK